MEKKDLDELLNIIRQLTVWEDKNSKMMTMLTDKELYNWNEAVFQISVFFQIFAERLSVKA